MWTCGHRVQAAGGLQTNTTGSTTNVTSSKKITQQATAKITERCVACSCQDPSQCDRTRRKPKHNFYIYVCYLIRTAILCSVSSYSMGCHIGSMKGGFQLPQTSNLVCRFLGSTTAYVTKTSWSCHLNQRRLGKKTTSLKMTRMWCCGI